MLGCPIETKEIPIHTSKEVCHDVHDTRHLKEHQNAMTSCEKLRQNAGEHFKFAGASYQRVVDVRSRTDSILNGAEQERVLADFSELHELIVETSDSFFLSEQLKGV
jgi:hypothetical protein